MKPSRRGFMGAAVALLVAPLDSVKLLAEEPLKDLYIWAGGWGWLTARIPKSLWMEINNFPDKIGWHTTFEYVDSCVLKQCIETGTMLEAQITIRGVTYALEMAGEDMLKREPFHWEHR